MHFLIATTDRWRRPVTVELRLRRDTVELRCGDRLRGVADREALGAWLRAPEGSFAYDDLTWFAAGPGIALAVDNAVPAWFLDEQLLTTLRVHL
jgi:hypothetical protein